MDVFHASPAERLFPGEGGTLEKFEHSTKPNLDCVPFFFLPFHPLLRHVRSEISESPAILSVPEPPASSPELAGATQPLWEPFLLVLSSQHNWRLNSHSNNSAEHESSSLLSAGMIKDEMASLISNEVAAGPLRQPQIGTRK